MAADPLDIRHRVGWLRYLDYVTFALWVTVVLVFVFIVIVPLDQEGGGAKDIWLGLAVLYMALAGGLTIAALILSVTSWTADKDKVRLALAPQTRHAVDRLCGTAGRQLFGTIFTGALGDQFVTVTLAAKTKECDQIRIRADAILALEEHPPGYP